MQYWGFETKRTKPILRGNTPRIFCIRIHEKSKQNYQKSAGRIALRRKVLCGLTYVLY